MESLMSRSWNAINTSLREHPEYLEMEGGSCACVMFIRKYPNGLTDQFLNELTNMDFPIIYSMDVEPLDNDVAYQMVMKKYMSNQMELPHGFMWMRCTSFGEKNTVYMHWRRCGVRSVSVVVSVPG